MKIKWWWETARSRLVQKPKKESAENGDAARQTATASKKGGKSGSKKVRKVRKADVHDGR